MIPHRTVRFASVFVLLAGSPAGFGGSEALATPKGEEPWVARVPTTWDEDSLRSLEMPLATATASPRYVSREYYDKLPIRPVFKSYPVYHPNREPPDYLSWLSKQPPEITFDASTLKSEEDWIRAGALVFDAPIEFQSEGLLFELVRDRAWYEKNAVPIAKDGIFPYMRYVVREPGRVELGFLACAMCHTRVMPDGSTIRGAQGNFPDDRTFAYEMRVEEARARDKESVLRDFRDFMRRNYAAPWNHPDVNARPDSMSFDEIATVLESIPPGVCARQGSSAFYPPRIPDLIGVKDRAFLDASGLVRHRSASDLMRYAALNQGADLLSMYGTFRPVGELPDPSAESRYSDEQLYALTLFVYSLPAPPNPNAFTPLAARGREVFDREGCMECHTPPLYTNNMLTPAEGFEMPEADFARDDILPMSVGTDPRLTMTTRRGTGYYKVPSLKGLWYRGPFEHNGSVATLEDWFDPARQRDDYVPTGFRGYGIAARAVRGHPYGLELSAEDRAALIAFLRTL